MLLENFMSYIDDGKFRSVYINKRLLERKFTEFHHMNQVIDPNDNIIII